MKMSIYCVGQKVIHAGINGRRDATVYRIRGGNIFIKFEKFPHVVAEVYKNDIAPIEEYIDPTSHYYHHSRFGEFQYRATIAFRSYMLAFNELEKLPVNVPQKFITFLKDEMDKYAQEYADAVALRDLASLNLNQWFDFESEKGYTLDHHFPFINPENIQGYHKL